MAVLKDAYRHSYLPEDISSGRNSLGSGLRRHSSLLIAGELHKQVIQLEA